ncbi:hypothetical protein HDU83_002723 [Entophlyctis luteolus]|nr:hypothetical protein HDU83_002723 [Entophlyctis luteolus]
MPRFRLFPSGAATAALASSAILVDVVRGSSSSVNDTASAGTTSTVRLLVNWVLDSTVDHTPAGVRGGVYNEQMQSVDRRELNMKGFGGNESAQLAYCSSSAIIFSADCCANVSSTTTKSKARTTAAFAAIQFDNVAGTTASAVASTTNGIGGLSAVAIVGIVIGCVVFVALVAVAWILFSNRKNVMRKTQILESPFVSPRNFSPTTNKNGYYVVPDTIELQQAGQRSPQASASPVRKEVVSLEYTSKFPDELSVKVGDTIEILEVFSDGWAKGKLQTAAGGFVEGMFPMACVDKSLQKDLM